MAFWNTVNAKDPKRNFRFVVRFTGLQGNETSVWWAKKVGKPNFSLQETSHKYLNHTFYWPGRVEWQPITLTLVDPVDPKSTATLNNLMEIIGYTPPNGPDDLITQSKQKSDQFLGAIEIEQIDSEGEPLETWKLHAPFIKKISYGELDYENDDLTSMDVEIRYDWAECNIAGDKTYFTTSA